MAVTDTSISCFVPENGTSVVVMLTENLFSDFKVGESIFVTYSLSKVEHDVVVHYPDGPGDYAVEPLQGDVRPMCYDVDMEVDFPE